MDTYFSNEAAGSYSPTLLRIRVKRKFDSKLNISLVHPFLKEEYPIFFHELIHHAQNTSSIIGLSHFDSVIGLWHNIRNLVSNKIDAASDYQARMAFDNIKFWEPNNNYLNTCLPISVLDIKYFNESSTEPTPINLTIKTENTDKTETAYFGLAEFMESSAYMLERYFCRQAAIIFQEDSVRSVPYKLGEAIAHHHNKSFSEIQIIAVKLTALQHRHPHIAYASLLNKIAPLSLSDDETITLLKGTVRDFINVNISWIDKIGDQLQQGFPIADKFFGDIVNSYYRIVKNLIMERIKNPFLELEFLNFVNPKNYKEVTGEFAEKLGGCIVIRDREDVSSDKMEKDRWHIFNGHSDLFKNTRAWKIFQTTIHYTLRHIICEGENLTILSPKNRTIEVQCPLYSSCNHNNRKVATNTCRKQPWDHMPPTKDDGSSCPYQIAVFKTDLANYR